MTTFAPFAPATAVGIDASSRRVSGLDSIRFLCAFIVMLGHIGLLNDRLHGSASVGLARIAIGIYNVLFNGPAAVIIFFLISGFCIHYPFRGHRALAPVSFYCRRFVRVWFPAAAFLLILRFVLHDKANPQNTVLWSVVCESIYYALYPLLLYVRRRSNWHTLLIISSAVAAIMIATHTSVLSDGLYGYVALGWSTWIIGLPCWLLGCWLAEHHHRFSVPSVSTIWWMRGSIYLLAMVLALIRFHVHSIFASNCILLDLFAIPACLWVGFELSYASRHGSNRILEWAGGWSYSLYLGHALVGPLLAATSLAFLEKQQSTHFLLLIISLVASYGFFLAVERPSHRLAVAIGRAADMKWVRPAVPASQS
jgi:peptidoglycan/LPS O-acetylase OafA/YrhL